MAIQINVLVKTEEGNFIREYEFSKDKAEKILNSPQDIIMIEDEKGNWTGDTINKRFIVNTENIPDRTYKPISSTYQIKEPSIEAKKAEFQRIRDIIGRTTDKLKEKGIIGKVI